jgi:orsellenic acid P450 oxidase
MTTESLLVETPPPSGGFDPYQDEVRRDPYPYYRWLLRHDPIHHGARDMWFVSPYADVKRVMSDALFDRSAGFRDYWTEMVGPGPLRDIMGLTIFFSDPEDHARLRRLIQRGFAPRIINALEPRIDEVVDQLLEPVLERGQMDAIADFAYPLPLIVLAKLLGVPAEDRAQLRDWSLAIGPTVDFGVTPEARDRGNAAMGEFVEYVRELLPTLRRGGQDSLLGGLAMATNEGLMTEDELISMAITLILSGHETTTNLIGNGLLALLRHPQQLELLRETPNLITNAVEECLRYDAPVQQNTREVQQDTELGDKALRRGEMVVVLQGAANRDPAQFPEPDRFDTTSTGIHPISFGVGRRFCLGAPLARLEAKIAFGRLLSRARDLELAAPDDELSYHPSSMFRALTSLPIALTAAES